MREEELWTIRNEDQTAVDTSDLTCGGDATNNNVWGQGRLDAYAAVESSPRGPTGTLQGMVTKAADGTPLATASLLVQGGHKDRTLGVGPDGTYKTRLSVGLYTVTAKAFGFIDQVAANVSIVDSTITVQDFALNLAPSFSLSGTVKTAAGSPMAGAQVAIVGTPLPPAIADSSGQYTFPSVLAGNYLSTRWAPLRLTSTSSSWRSRTAKWTFASSHGRVRETRDQFAASHPPT